MRIGVLFSSGKDSTATIWYYLEQGWDIACLLSLIPENTDSYMFQTPSEELLRKQAGSLQIPLVVQQTPGEKEAELGDLKNLLEKARDAYDITGVAVGALASDYQQERVNRICHEVGLKTYAPLWHKNQEALMRQLIGAGFDIRMTRIAADGLDESWLGRRLTQQDVDRLIALNKRIGLSIAGEGGEFETIVLGGPIFGEQLSIEYDTIMETAHRGELSIKSVKEQ